jgi:hypothetical protein
MTVMKTFASASAMAKKASVRRDDCRAARVHEYDRKVVRDKWTSSGAVRASA